MACRILAERSRRVGCNGITDLSAVKDVREFGADLETEPILFEVESPAKIQILLWAARRPEIVVIGSRRWAEGSVGRIRPGGGVQDYIAIRVDTATVQVLKVERLAGNAELLATDVDDTRSIANAEIVRIGRRRRR